MMQPGIALLVFGLFNQLLELAGLPSQRFLNAPGQALPAIAAYGVWKNLGFTMVLLLAGLTTIDRSFYGAARVDGARPWQLFRHITLFLAILAATLAQARLLRTRWEY